MRTVFPNQQVAHVWAQQNQSEGRNANSSVRFRGRVLYSYAEPIAAFVEGGAACLVTSRTFSVTTTRHTSRALQAIPPGVRVMRAVDVSSRCFGPDHERNRAAFAEEITAATLRIAKARKNKDWAADTAKRAIDNANSYAEVFGLEWRFDPLSPEAVAAAVEGAKARKEAEKKRAAKQAEEAREAMAEWIAGTRHVAPAHPETFLRISGDGESVQTSRGAVVPVAHARRAWPFILAGFREGFHRNGTEIRLGAFQVDSIGEGVLRAGCHTVKQSEVERIAGLLGLSLA